MSKLSNYLVEQILLVEDTTEIKNKVVIYSGRFQPMHKGHYAVYKKLVKKFGKANVYIGTSNVTDNKKSPFNFKEKKQIATTMFDIPKSKFVQVKNPYKPVEVLSNFDKDTTAYITVLGEKDANRFNGKYFLPAENNLEYGYGEHGYIYIVPIMGFGISGTDARNGLISGTPEEQHEFFKTRVYDKFDKGIFNLITSKLNKGFVIQKETIEEWLLNEATINGPSQADDGPAAFFPNLKVFTKMSIERAKQIGYDVLDMIMTKEVEDYYEHPDYPDGPVKAVSYYPAGVIGKMTPNNQIDIYANGAYTKWYKHVTRQASLTGYTVLSTQLQKARGEKIKKMSVDMAKADRDIEAEFELYLNESITLPVEIGDTLLMGKFKNKKTVVKTIGKDEHGMPTINGKKVVTFRYGKKAPNIFENQVIFEDELNSDSYNKKNNKTNEIVSEGLTDGFKNLGVPRKDMPQIASHDVKKYIEFLKENGISVKYSKIYVKKLNLTQKDINPDKIKALMSTKVSNLSKPLIISKDYYILDGHHRLLALYALDNNAKISVVQVDQPIATLLQTTRNFGDVSFKHIHEVMINEAQQKLKLTIPSNVKKIVKAFKKHGKKVYIVGGAVRDAILGQSPHDFDLSTDAKAHEMVSICDKEGLKHVDTDIIYGTVVIEGEEVTQFRKDIGGSRKLDGIDYTDIQGDVKRRDLTVNALFYDIDRGEIVDLVGGIADLKKKLIKTVGNAADRFEEDHLRKLRAVRFTVKLGGTMETDTLLAIKKDPTLKDVSSERIRMEFMKSVESAKSTKIYLDLMEKLKFLPLTFPNLKISKPYVDCSDYIVLMSYILRDNKKEKLESQLNKITYTAADIKNISFLQSLIKFDPKDIVSLKKAQKVSSVKDSQIKEFGKLLGQNFKKFLKFKPTVKGNDVPKEIKGRDIGVWISKEETRKFLKENKTINEEIPVNTKITTFKELFNKLPSDLQKRVFALKHIAQSPKWHPEGNVLKHTITVVTRALKQSGDIDLALAAIFHDIGKDETSGINPKTGAVTHYGHEFASSKLVKKYDNFITSIGGNTEDIHFIVHNHMRMKNFDVMRLIKQRKLQSHKAFDKLQQFSAKFDRGGLKEEVDVTEMAKSDLKSVETFADKTLSPEDIEFTRHFFERLNDPRNKKEISTAELIGFFKRLSKHKKEFLKFVDDYKEIMVKDDKTKINIPFVKQANKLIAKTVMRTANWTQKKTPEYKFESIEDLVNDIDIQLESFVLPTTPLKESGKVTGGSPIPAEHTMDMYGDVAKILKSEFKIKDSDIKPLGSTGKKKSGDFCGDIDIAFDGVVVGSIHKLKFDEVQKFIYDKLKSKFKKVVNMPGIGIVSFLYPIPNSDDYGQVDLMITDNVKLTEFIFHSPNFINNESKYKGLYRNVLMYSIIKYIETGDVNTYFETGKDKGEVKEFSKYSLTQKSGLIKQLKSFEGKMGKTKNPSPVKGADSVIATIPNDIVKFIFGGAYTTSDLNSFEDIYTTLNSSGFKHKKYKAQIISNFKDSIQKLKLPLPSEIKE